MGKRNAEISIDGQRYRLTQPGAETIAELGEKVIEAAAMTMQGKTGLAVVLREVRTTLVGACQVLVIDSEDEKKKARYVELALVFSDHFAGDQAKSLGKWFVWAAKESGLTAFLGGMLSGTVPSLKDKLPSVFRMDAAGSSTDSSIPSA
jgi:hypothetical protein